MVCCPPRPSSLDPGIPTKEPAHGEETRAEAGPPQRDDRQLLAWAPHRHEHEIGARARDPGGDGPEIRRWEEAVVDSCHDAGPPILQYLRHPRDDIGLVTQKEDCAAPIAQVTQHLVDEIGRRHSLWNYGAERPKPEQRPDAVAEDHIHRLRRRREFPIRMQELEYMRVDVGSGSTLASRGSRDEGVHELGSADRVYDDRTDAVSTPRTD